MITTASSVQYSRKSLSGAIIPALETSSTTMALSQVASRLSSMSSSMAGCTLLSSSKPEGAKRVPSVKLACNAVAVSEAWTTTKSEEIFKEAQVNLQV